MSKNLRPISEIRVDSKQGHQRDNENSDKRQFNANKMFEIAEQKKIKGTDENQINAALDVLNFEEIEISLVPSISPAKNDPNSNNCLQLSSTNRTVGSK